jgi:hypothetical protein
VRFLCLYNPAKPEGTPPTHLEIAEMGTDHPWRRHP